MSRVLLAARRPGLPASSASKAKFQLPLPPAGFGSRTASRRGASMKEYVFLGIFALLHCWALGAYSEGGSKESLDRAKPCAAAVPAGACDAPGSSG